jgi:hypothetical protein
MEKNWIKDCVNHTTLLQGMGMIALNGYVVAIINFLVNQDKITWSQRFSHLKWYAHTITFLHSHVKKSFTEGLDIHSKQVIWTYVYPIEKMC